MSTAVTVMTFLSFPVLVTLTFPPTAIGLKLQPSLDMDGSMDMLLFQSPMPWPRRFVTNTKMQSFIRTKILKIH